MFPDFFVDHNTIRQRISDIQPSNYASTRNHLQGTVTYLGPFITHGVIDTTAVAEALLERHTGRTAEKLLTELAWREYFHRVWQAYRDGIFADLRHPQENVISDQIPEAIGNAETGITTVDDCLSALMTHGYMHNHARMWLAAITCNVGRTHWYQPARWLYYHLLDGDIASNTLSWQWVCGSFSHRKYYANQDNLNRYAHKPQGGTFLDKAYDELPTMAVPEALLKRVTLTYVNQFPATTATPVHATDSKVLLHSLWNLDPMWRHGDTGRRILWIEPSMHTEFALSPLRWRFIEHWAKQIAGLEIFVGEKEALFPQGTENINVISREYPSIEHWPTDSKGQRDPRRWCYPEPEGPIRSFSSYWKPIRKSSELFRNT